MQIVIIIALVIAFGIVIFLASRNTSSENTNTVDDIKPEPSPEINNEDVTETTHVSEPNTKSLSSDNAVVIGYALTGTENEVYQEKLQDPNWKNKSKEIKQRDGFKCQHCSSTGDELIELEFIDEIEDYVDFPVVAEIVKGIFNNKDIYIKEFELIRLNENFECIDNVFELAPPSFLSRQKRYDEFNIIQSRVVDKKGNWLCNENNNRTEILTKEEVDLSSFWGIQKEIEVSNYTFKKKESTDTCNLIMIEYFPIGNTKGKIYLRSAFKYIKMKYPGQCILTIDGFSIIYPLYALNFSKLNVHHKAYYDDLEPWDDRINHELITLCKKCHTAAHRAVGNKIPIKKFID